MVVYLLVLVPIGVRRGGSSIFRGTGSAGSSLLATLAVVSAASRAALALALACSTSSLALATSHILGVACSRVTASPVLAFFLPGFTVVFFVLFLQQQTM
jgi:hypothetical protein